MFSDNKPQKNYFNIVGGKLTVNVPEGTLNAISRVNKNGKTVHEVKHDSFTGKMLSITPADSQWGKNWEIDFEAVDGQIWTLQVGYSSSYAKSFLKRLPNIDINETFTITPFSGEIDGKKISTITVYQNGVKIAPFYTKETPNGLPQLEQIMVKGVETWDDTKQLQFLEASVKEIMSKVSNTKMPPQTIEEAEALMNEGVDESLVIDENDLPF